MLSKLIMPTLVILGLSGAAVAQTRQGPDPTGTAPSASSTEKRSLSPTREGDLGTIKDNGDLAAPPTPQPAGTGGSSMPPDESPASSSHSISGNTTEAPAPGRPNP